MNAPSPTPTQVVCVCNRESVGVLVLLWKHSTALPDLSAFGQQKARQVEGKKMPAILVTPKMKSGLPKPVHSALPIPQAHIQTRMTQSSGAKLTHHSSLRRSSQGTGAPQRKSQTANETSADPQVWAKWFWSDSEVDSTVSSWLMKDLRNQSEVLALLTNFFKKMQKSKEL